MAGRYKAYQEYKDSGVEWLKEIPIHWDCKKLKFFLNDLVRGPFGSALKKEFFTTAGIKVYEQKNCIQDSVALGDSYISEDTYRDLSRFTVTNGDLLMSCSGTIGRIVEVTEPYEKGIINQALLIMRINECAVNKAFFKHIFRSEDVQKQIKDNTQGGAMQNLVATDVFKSVSFTVPPYEEQQKIASFLDHETAKIDTLIAKQEKLIELLKEKRQAVISHAVTKGLNPDAPMKDSGVEWLGEVPEHWDVTKFSYAIDFLEGPGILAVDFHDEGIPLLRIQNVKEAVVTDNFKTYLDPLKVKEKWEHFRVEKGDLLISASASTGLISEVDERAVGAVPYTGLIRLKPVSASITKDFIRFVVQSDLFYEQIKLLQTGSTIQHFGPIHLQQMKVVLPPVDEQNRIAKEIKHSIKHIDRLTENAESIIDLTKERKTALISAAVTGKIDVRHFVAEQGQPQGV